MNEKTLIAGYPVTERVGLKNQLKTSLVNFLAVNSNG